MTTTTDLLTDLAALGVTLAADGDRLRFHPRDRVTGKLLARLRDCKADLLAMLASGPQDAPSNAGPVRQPQTPTATTAPRPRSAGPVAVEWPGAAADFCLLLTPDDLPPVPFRLNGWTQVTDAEKLLRSLRADILRGPTGPRAFYGALQADLLALQRFALTVDGRDTTAPAAGQRAI